MIASEILNPRPLTLKPNAPVMSIMQMFRDYPNFGFAVVNEYQVVMGVVSKDDLFTANLNIHIPTYLQLLENARFAKDSKKELPYAAQQVMNSTAEDVMDQSVFFAHVDTPVETIAAVLATGKQVLVPVVDQDNKLLGVIENLTLLKSLSGGAPEPHVETVVHQRPVDTELTFVQKDMSSRFSYIARSRAHLWLSTTIILFVIGFALGIIFIVDPQPIAKSIDGNIQQLLQMLFK